VIRECMTMRGNILRTSGLPALRAVILLEMEEEWFINRMTPLTLYIKCVNLL
jgi:hypothetical protein